MTLRKLFLFAAPVAAFFVGMFALATLASAQQYFDPAQPFTGNNGYNINAPIHEGSAVQAKGTSVLWSLGLGNNTSIQDTVESGKFYGRNESYFGQVAAQRFCLRNPSSPNLSTTDAVAFFVYGNTTNYNCITSWPTSGTPATSLWTDQNPTLVTTAGRHIRVPGPAFGAAGNTAEVILGDGGHKIGAAWGNGLFFDTFNIPAGSTHAMVIKESTGNVGIATDTPTAKLDVNGTFRLRGTPTPGQALIATAAGDGTVEWGNAGLPPGTVNQTLRHNGTGWVANSKLQNDGNGVRIGSNNVLGPNWGLPFSGADLAVGGKTILQSDINASVVPGTKTTIGFAGMPDELKLDVIGYSQLGKKTRLNSALPMSSGVTNAIEGINLMNGWNVLQGASNLQDSTTISEELIISDGTAQKTGKVLSAIDNTGRARWIDPNTLITATAPVATFVPNSYTTVSGESSQGAGINSPSCNAGDVLVGGGGECVSNVGVLEASRPDGTDKWYARCGGTSRVKAYAICLGNAAIPAPAPVTYTWNLGPSFDSSIAGNSCLQVLATGGYGNLSAQDVAVNNTETGAAQPGYNTLPAGYQVGKCLYASATGVTIADAGTGIPGYQPVMNGQYLGGRTYLRN